jgi:sRNA-binding regulator protein Hfq
MKEFAEPTNRKLIRPSLTEVKDQGTNKRPPPQQKVKRTTPPEQTHAENFYYLKQMQNRTPMVLVLKDGEELRGYIEWYDRTCLKVNREGEPNLLVYKDSVKYLYKESERKAASGNPSRGKTNGAPRV